jgi:hypothetical protein
MQRCEIIGILEEMEACERNLNLWNKQIPVEQAEPCGREPKVWKHLLVLT